MITIKSLSSNLTSNMWTVPERLICRLNVAIINLLFLYSWLVITITQCLATFGPPCNFTDIFLRPVNVLFETHYGSFTYQLTLKMPTLGPPLADTMLTFSWDPSPLADSQRPLKKCRTASILVPLKKNFRTLLDKIVENPNRRIFSYKRLFELNIKSFFSINFLFIFLN